MTSESTTPSPAAEAPSTGEYVRKGFGLKSAVQDSLAADYTGQLVDLLRDRDFALEVGDTSLRDALERLGANVISHSEQK